MYLFDVPSDKQSMLPTMMMLSKMRLCTMCDRLSVHAKVCARCKVDHYCSRECQAAHWPAHRPVCSPNQKNNRRVMKKLKKAALRLLESTEHERFQQRHPSQILVLQYVGTNVKPSEEMLMREMHIAMVYAEHRVLRTDRLPPPSSIIQGAVRPTPERQRLLFGGCLERGYIALSAWVGKSGMDRIYSGVAA